MEFKNERIEARLDSIEKLLKMLVMSDVLNGIDAAITEESTTSCPELEEFIARHGLQSRGYEVIGGIQLLKVAVQSNEKTSIKDFIELRNESEGLNEFVLCFQFESINGMKKKRMIEEKISFIVENKEVHIYPRQKVSGRE